MVELPDIVDEIAQMMRLAEVNYHGRAATSSETTASETAQPDLDGTGDDAQEEEDADYIPDAMHLRLNMANSGIKPTTDTTESLYAQMKSMTRRLHSTEDSDHSSGDITNQETHDEPSLIVDALHIEIYLASRYIIPVFWEEILARDEHSIA